MILFSAVSQPLFLSGLTTRGRDTPGPNTKMQLKSLFMRSTIQLRYPGARKPINGAAERMQFGCTNARAENGLHVFFLPANSRKSMTECVRRKGGMHFGAAVKMPQQRSSSRDHR